jgi:hypothetical protein
MKAYYPVHMGAGDEYDSSTARPWPAPPGEVDLAISGPTAFDLQVPRLADSAHCFKEVRRENQGRKIAEEYRLKRLVLAMQGAAGGLRQPPPDPLNKVGGGPSEPELVGALFVEANAARDLLVARVQMRYVGEILPECEDLRIQRPAVLENDG